MIKLQRLSSKHHHVADVVKDYFLFERIGQRKQSPDAGTMPYCDFVYVKPMKIFDDFLEFLIWCFAKMKASQDAMDFSFSGQVNYMG